MYIQSKIETRYQTPHPNLEIVSIIHYRAEVENEEVNVSIAWVIINGQTCTIPVSEENNSISPFLSILHNDAREKAYKIIKGLLNNNHHNGEESRYFEYNP